MNKVFGATLLVLALVTGGCMESGPGDERGGGGGIGTPREMPGDGGGTPRETPPATASLVVQNDSGYSIWYLYVSPSTTSDWGPDQLGANILDPGESFRLSDVPCNRSYDLKADGLEGTLATQFGVFFACGETMTWRLY